MSWMDLGCCGDCGRRECNGWCWWHSFKERYPDTSRLMVIQAALLITLILFSAAAELTVRIIRNIYAYHSKPSIQLVEPPRIK